jgi:hypothetical protein
MNDLAGLLHQAHASSPLEFIDALGLAASFLTPLYVLFGLIGSAVELPVLGSFFVAVSIAFRIVGTLLLLIVAAGLVLLSHVASVGASGAASLAHAITRVITLCRAPGLG